MRNIDQNLQRNNVARQFKGFGIAYFAAFTDLWAKEQFICNFVAVSGKDSDLRVYEMTIRKVFLNKL